MSDSSNVSLFDGFAAPLRGEAAAHKFCSLLGDGEAFIFEGYFPKCDARRKDAAVATRRFRGTFAAALPALRAWQDDRRSVYLRINEGGSVRDDITRVRAISIEFDAAEQHHQQHQSLPDGWHLTPSLLVRRGNSLHAHWIVDDCPVERFEEVQQRLQRQYQSDPKPIGIERIWRCPGFAHPLFPDQEVELLVRDCEDWESSYKLSAIEAGLSPLAPPEPELVVSEPWGEQIISEAEFRVILSHIDPTFADDYRQWIGLTKTIRFGQVPLVDADSVDWIGLVDDWCSGRLWCARTGDKDFVVPTYEGCEQTIQHCGSKPRTSGHRFTLGSFVRRAKATGYAGPALTILNAAASSRSDFTSFVLSSTTQRPLKNFENTLVAVNLMPAKPEFNAFTRQVVFRDAELPWGEELGRVFDDSVQRAIRAYFIAHFGLDVSKDHVIEAVQTRADFNQYHPVKEYFASLVWDGVKRIDSWLVEMCGAADTAFTRAAGRKFLVGAVARIMSPGCKFDHVLALEGTQGIGKSSVFRILASDDYFTDCLPTDVTKVDTIQALQGKWIIEMPELEGLSRGEVSAVKAFVTRQVDRGRFAYGRLTGDYPRQCVFGATTNESGYLRDQTGGRRFWPVKVATIDLERLCRVRDQIWAEAFVAFSRGEVLELPPEAAGEALIAQEGSFTAHPWEESIRHFVAEKSLTRVHSSTLLTGALGLLPASQTSTHARTVRNIMEKRLDWTYKKSIRIGTRVNSGYERVQELEDWEIAAMQREDG
ncbi:MAG TPA: virulence-associated E family protein [Rhizomicrobium sp.]|nr:virulence-associated E family protein [Rhizomicrobium sp.]